MGTARRSYKHRTWALAFAAATLALVAFIATAMTGGATQTYADTSLDTEEQAFMTLLNEYRAQNGLGPVIIDPSMQNAAEWMSTDMGEENYFSHTDSLGRSPWDRLCDFNYCHNTWKGENIAAGYSTGAQVFQGWRNSPGHNSNMLGTHYVVMGLARVQTPGSTYGWYWTNDFGGLQVEPSPPPAPTNTPSVTASPAPTAPRTDTPTPVPTSTPGPTPTATPTATAAPQPTTPKPTVTTEPPTETPEPSGTPFTADVAADLDCDNQVTGLDSLALLLFLSGLAEPNDSCPPVGSAGAQTSGLTPVRGDFNCTGTITSADALSILRYTAGDDSAVRISC